MVLSLRGNHHLVECFYSVAWFDAHDISRVLKRRHCVHNMVADWASKWNQTFSCLVAELNEVWYHLRSFILSLFLKLSIPLLANVSKALFISHSWRALKGDVWTGVKPAAFSSPRWNRERASALEPLSGSPWGAWKGCVNGWPAVGQWSWMFWNWRG